MFAGAFAHNAGKPVDMKEVFIKRIQGSLERRSHSQCSKWAEKYRIMGSPFPGPYSFRHHPWARDMHDSVAYMNVGQKAAQMGFTEILLNRTFYNIDIHRSDVLYLLPSKEPDANDFSSGRFDPALELSEYLAGLFSDTRNKGHKRAGPANLYIRGARSRGGLKSIPTGIIIFDERDEMPEESVPLALERASGQLKKEIFQISTPTIPNWGINTDFNKSTKSHFFFSCPSCSKSIEFKFPESIVITADHHEDARLKDSYYTCYECDNILPHETKEQYLNGTNEWVKSRESDILGWYVNQMYSSTITPADIAYAYLKGQSNEFYLQEFWNSKMGLPYAGEGASVTEDDLQKCIALSNYLMYPNYRPANRIITMGADVGKWIHYEIDEWIVRGNVGVDVNMMSTPKVLAIGKCLSFDELGTIFQKYGVMVAVVDKNPETRKALEFAMRFYGRVRLCQYLQGISGKNCHLSDEKEAEISVDRSSWLDLSLGRFRGRSILLPQNTPHEYKNHIKALVRRYKTDKKGTPFVQYIATDEDHYAHARNYSEIALQMAAKLGEAQNVGRIN